MLRTIRILAVGAFALPAALAIAVPGTSSAATKPPTVTCSAVTGTLTTQKLAKCTGDTSVGTTATATKAGTLITWSAKGGGTEHQQDHLGQVSHGQGRHLQSPQGPDEHVPGHRVGIDLGGHGRRQGAGRWEDLGQGVRVLEIGRALPGFQIHPLTPQD